jgi:hypothetical protein
MFRPATITHPVVVNDGKPFDALTATLQFDYQNCGTVSILYYRDGVQIEEPLIEGLDTVAGDLFVNLIKWQLAQALNPPIKVTQAVLDAMKKQAVESKLLGGNVAHYKRYSDHGAWFSFYLWDVDMGWWCGYHNSYYTDEDLLMGYVQADSKCPLALQVLLNFTTEGVPVND